MAAYFGGFSNSLPEVPTKKRVRSESATVARYD
jgi:hypothetical protein